MRSNVRGIVSQWRHLVCPVPWVNQTVAGHVMDCGESRMKQSLLPRVNRQDGLGGIQVCWVDMKGGQRFPKTPAGDGHGRNLGEQDLPVSHPMIFNHMHPSIHKARKPALIGAKTTIPIKHAASRNAHPGSDFNASSICTLRMMGVLG